MNATQNIMELAHGIETRNINATKNHVLYHFAIRLWKQAVKHWEKCEYRHEVCERSFPIFLGPKNGISKCEDAFFYLRLKNWIDTLHLCEVMQKELATDIVFHNQHR